jgi:hypothetical protein
LLLLLCCHCGLPATLLTLCSALVMLRCAQCIKQLGQQLVQARTAGPLQLWHL